MKKPRLQQRGERRIAAALRIALAAALLAVQVLFVVLTTRYLKDHFALIYGALEGIALITALYIYNKPGDLSYRVAWIIPILFVPVVGLILYLLWGGDTQRKRLQRQTAPKLPPEGVAAPENRAQTALLLWNTAGRPEPAEAPAFADVADPDTAKAAQWCVEQGLMKRRLNGKFAPDSSIPAYQVLNAYRKLAG